ncbi:MAG: shikimate dehydrogenase [Acidimicrobiia bacterium]|nr:shikimate dehydrogenase [Acidimicrobiia bacterium]
MGGTHHPPRPIPRQQRVTSTVALIGTPLKRRHSGVMHNAAFSHFGIDARYELRELAETGLPEFVAEVREGEWLGFQVTAPHKQAVIAHLDRVEQGAAAIGAVNSVINDDDGGLTGFNTDASGFRHALTDTLGATIDGSRFVVVGAGGAARAVVWTVLNGGAGEVVVANRSLQRATDLVADFADLGNMSALRTDELDVALASADVAVNATTVGMSSGELAFDVDAIPREAAVFDLVYVPPETALVRAALDRGLRVCNGIEMLVSQAALAFERWTGVSDAAPVMRNALEEWDGQSDRK